MVIIKNNNKIITLKIQIKKRNNKLKRNYKPHDTLLTNKYTKQYAWNKTKNIKKNRNGSP